MPLLLSVCFFVLALIGTSIHLVHWGTAELVMKTMPAAFLTLCAVGFTRKHFGYWVVLGVGMGAVGDFALWMNGQWWGLLGVVAFLLGHIGYGAAFRKNLQWTPLKGVVILVTVLFIVAVSAWSAAYAGSTVSRPELAALSLYVLAMGGMMVLAVLHKSPTMLIAAGSILFIISDAHIAVRHGMPHSTRMLCALSGFVTYYLAQYLLVAGAARESRAAEAVASPQALLPRPSCYNSCDER